MSTASKNNKTSQFRFDVIAGLSIAGLLLPSSVAYASIANLPPQAGIITLFAGLLCYGLLGSSRFAIASPTSSSAAVMAAAITSMLSTLIPISPEMHMALVISLVLMVGVLFLIAACFCLGNITSFIAKPVLRGFTFGLAIIIILNQFNIMTGTRTLHNDTFKLFTESFSQIANWNWAGLVLGISALILLLVLSHFKKLPAALIVVILGIIIGKWGNLVLYEIALTGTIDLHLNTPTIPILPVEQWVHLGGLAFATVMVLYAESYSSIQSFALKHGDTVRPNRDLFALGVANLISGLFQGMPVGAGYSTTSANEAAGARSRLSGWIAMVVIFIMVLTLLPSIELIPRPILAAIVIFAVGHTLNLNMFKPYFHWHRDRLLVICATLAILFLGILDGLLVAVAISIALMLRQLSDASIVTLGRLDNGHDFVIIGTHNQAQAVPGILIPRPNAQIFFANAERVFNEIRAQIQNLSPFTHSVIISLEESPDLDSSSLEALMDFCQYMQTTERHLLLARLKEPVIEVLQRLDPPILPFNSLSELSVDEAVHMANKLHDAEN